LKQVRLRDEEKAQMLQREQMIAMAFQHQAAALAAKALSVTTSSSTCCVLFEICAKCYSQSEQPSRYTSFFNLANSFSIYEPGAHTNCGGSDK
jgi:hypothetical protein